MSLYGIIPEENTDCCFLYENKYMLRGANVASRLSHCLATPAPHIGVCVSVSTALLPIQFLAGAPREAVEES